MIDIINEINFETTTTDNMYGVKKMIKINIVQNTLLVIYLLKVTIMVKSNK